MTRDIPAVTPGVEIFDGQADLHVQVTVLPHFVRLSLLNLTPSPLSHVHVDAFPSLPARLYSRPAPFAISPSEAGEHVLVYETDRDCACEILISFTSNAGDLLQCRTRCTLLKSDPKGLLNKSAWDPLCGALPRCHVSCPEPRSGGEVIEIFSSQLQARFLPLETAPAPDGALPVYWWASVHPVVIIHFTPPADIAVYSSEHTVIEDINKSARHWLNEPPVNIRPAFEVGELVERLQWWLGMGWYTDEVREKLGVIARQFHALKIPCPIQSLEILVAGKKSLGDLSDAERETFTLLVKTLKGLISP